jgi:hypothetical protein
MATVRQEIGEIDVVVFAKAAGKWPAGTRGTVVIDFGDDKMVEIANDRGETLDLPVIPADQLELIAKYSD